ncbi:unnamed protein product [Strongylus vulgaris]|uniref:Uncharacterized protein n=1 Tax=Strongylus vulgaris TaxID=40348 RepID=A0A3P7IS80_STRVU|nr:unnamed protein product [Strongylus vulgaris]
MDPATSEGSVLPNHEQARIHSSSLEMNAKVVEAPPAYEEVDTTISRGIISTDFPESIVTITAQPTNDSCVNTCCHATCNAGEVTDINLQANALNANNEKPKKLLFVV